MPSRIHYSPMSLKDLDEIWEYISNELMNPSAAENTISGILNSLDSLEEFPETGSKLVFDNGLDSGYRFVIYKNYIAFYHLQNGFVYVDRVIYRKRDYMKILFPDEIQ